MIKKSIIVSVRMGDEQVTKLNKLIEDGVFPNAGEAIRQLIEVGHLTLNYRQQAKDPEFIKTLDKLKEDDNILQWFDTLTPEQLDGVYFYSKMKRESRYEVSKLL